MTGLCCWAPVTSRIADPNLGGNGTLVGVSANLTIVGITERNDASIGFLTFMEGRMSSRAFAGPDQYAHCLAEVCIFA